MIRQQGQVLPLGLALLLFGVLGAFVLFNTGQVATDKMRLANTADAAAYSGVLWQARALNFQSYTNRAMVANQVSIAQAVTLQSWVSYGAVASQNMAAVLSPVPILNVIASGLETGLSVVERTLSPVSKAIVAVVDVVNRGLSVAQEAMFVSTFVATPDVIKSVVRETDARFEVNTGFGGIGLADNLSQWRSFTDGYTEDDAAAMDERAALIMQSRDGFTRDRNWEFFSFWFYSTPLTRHKMFREGDTRLVKSETANGTEWEWKAKDTMSLHNRLWHWQGTKRWEVPVGWAEAFANTANSDRSIESGSCATTRETVFNDCSRFLAMNGRGEYLADIGIRGPIRGTETRTAMSGYTGLQAYRSLSTASIEEGNPHLQLKVEVALPVEQINSTDSLGSRGSFSAAVDAPGDKLSSISVAEVFYKRPDADTRADDRLELANGYNPYWDTRLSAVSAQDRLLAFSLRSGTAVTSAPDGLPSTLVALSEYPESDGSLSESLDLSSSSIAAFNDSNPELPTLAEGASFDDVVSSMSGTDLDQFRDSINEQLNDALKDAVRDMLSGALPDIAAGADDIESMSQELREQSEEQLSELVSEDAAQPYLDAVEEAENIARELEAEFERIRQTIVDEFAVELASAKADIAEREAGLQALIISVTEEMENSAANEEGMEDYQDTISSYRSELRALRSEMREHLVQALIDIVGNASNLYIMRYSEARFLVDQLLLDDSDTVTLPWLEGFDDE